MIPNRPDDRIPTIIAPKPQHSPLMIACIHKDCPMNGLYHTGSQRQDEKQLQRKSDEEEIRLGITTVKEMRERNGYFAVDSRIDFGQDDF